MIVLDGAQALAVFLGLFIAAVFGSWCIQRKWLRKDLFLDPRFIWFCSVCTHSYICTRDEDISVCPRCGSYNKKSVDR